MARKQRIEKIGFYHIINRGVERRNIFLDDEDHNKFLDIIEDSSIIYQFSIYSFCLMNNHYHLLLKTTQENLSLIMRQINSRYSIYFNNKYKRVGPLWQGRFKSWYVFDEVYLNALIKYIEYNPIKANIATNIFKFKWAMSSRNIDLSVLNFELLKIVDLQNSINQSEQNKLDELFDAKFRIKDNIILKSKKKSLKILFELVPRDIAIFNAIKNGYTQSEIAKFLKLSNVSISKTLKIYRQKVELFNKLRDKGIFWSYSKSIDYKNVGENLMIEYLLKYGNFDDILLGFKLYGKRIIKQIWENKLKSDKQFIKLNLMLSRVFFNMDVESDYFKEIKNERFEKLKLLAS